jgi:hypothetical protein
MENNKRKNDITPMWFVELTGNYRSMGMTEEMLSKLRSMKPGQRILFKFLKADNRKSEKSPHAYLEILE